MAQASPNLENDFVELCVLEKKEPILDSDKEFSHTGRPTTSKLEDNLQVECDKRSKFQNKHKSLSNSIDSDREVLSTLDSGKKNKTNKKDSFKWNLKKKTSIDLEWFRFHSSCPTDSSTSRKHSVDCGGDDMADSSTILPTSSRSTKGSFDLGRVSLRFAKRNSSEDPQLEEPQPLTEEQKVIVKETWKIVEDQIAKVGVIMFVK